MQAFKHTANPCRLVLASFEHTEMPDLLVRSANGSFIDRAESAALEAFTPGTPALFPKRSLGEAPGASALLQTITAVLALEKQGLRRALVPVIGFNQQASAALLEVADAA